MCGIHYYSNVLVNSEKISESRLVVDSKPAELTTVCSLQTANNKDENEIITAHIE